MLSTPVRGSGCNSVNSRREVITVLAGRDIAGAAALVPDEAAEAFGIAGTPQHCATRLRDFIEAGMDEPVLGLSGKNEERKLALDACASSRGGRLMAVIARRIWNR